MYVQGAVLKRWRQSPEVMGAIQRMQGDPAFFEEVMSEGNEIGEKLQKLMAAGILQIQKAPGSSGPPSPRD